MPRYTFEFVKYEDKVLNIDEAVEVYGQRMVEYCTSIIMIVEVEAENYREAKEKMLELMRMIVNNTNSITCYM